MSDSSTTSGTIAASPRDPVESPATSTRPEWTNFRLLLSGQSVSLFGTAVTTVALPIVAVLQLNATTFEVGVIAGAEYVAYSVLGLLAGVFVDRWPRRAVLLWSDAARTVIISAVPVLWLLGRLQVWHLIVVALLMGVFQLFFDTAHQAYLPSIISRRRLIKGNAYLQTSASINELAGPGIAGVLVQWVGAAMTLVVDSLSYLVSFVAIMLIRPGPPEPAAQQRTPEPAAEQPGPGLPTDGTATGRNRRARRRREPGERIVSQIVEGFRYIGSDRILRSFLGTIAQFNLLVTAEQALQVIFLLRVVRVGPAAVGLLLAATGVGAIIGAVLARRLVNRLGIGRAMILAAFFGPIVGVLIPFTDPGLRLSFFVLGNAALGATTTTLKVAGVSYRQAAVPPHLLGRVVATNRALTWGPLPLAGLLAGGLGQLLGVRQALIIIALLMVTAPLWLVFTPIWRTRNLNEVEVPG